MEISILCRGFKIQIQIQEPVIYTHIKRELCKVTFMRSPLKTVTAHWASIWHFAVSVLEISSSGKQSRISMKLSCEKNAENGIYWTYITSILSNK